MTLPSARLWQAAAVSVVIVYLHNAVPYLTTLPRVNVDEPWLMERAYQVMRTGAPSQPMLGLHHAYLLQVGYGYLLAGWMALTGVGLAQARALDVVFGLGIIAGVAAIGRRTIDPAAGLAAALFLALDSNFLGGVRNARTDIPSVFFIVCAFAAYLRGVRLSRTVWFACAGASLGLALLCHGNAFWAGLILLAWYLLDYGRRGVAVPFGYALLAGFLLTFGPYLAVVLTHWPEVRTQIANFAADRVPGWNPAFIAGRMLVEVQRYRGWYFGLVTSTVPNPLLRIFQFCLIAGVLTLVQWVIPYGAGRDAAADPRGPRRLLILAAGGALIFAAFINNKVPVYMPHLLVGFALAAGSAVSASAAALSRTNRAALTLAFVAAYGGAGVAYYEKWYSSALKSELVSYEATSDTLHALAPRGPKYLFASPQFWTPFHDEAGATFYSYAAAQPARSGSATVLGGAGDDRPIFLIVDELQWLPELVGVSSSTAAWQQAWIDFIERNCMLDGAALGTAHGTLALYRCALGGAPVRTLPEPRIIGGGSEYRIGAGVMIERGSDLARWARYDDPRRTAAARPEVRPTGAGVQVSGTGWPGIVTTFAAVPGEDYLVRTSTDRTRDGDLLYLGMWQQPQVRALSGAASAGIAAPLALPRWFPADRAFRATSTAVRVLVYSEAPETDFVISSLDIYRLNKVN